MYEHKVSVIIPCYKAEKHIGKCIDMIQSQSYKNLEIIVIIDGKTDNSEAIARSYKDVKVIVFESNRGLSAGRNAGIDAATGKYIHFMDVDDKINQTFYYNLVQSCEKTGADIACSCMYNEKAPYQCQIFSRQKVAQSIHDRMKISWVAKWGYVWRYLFNLDFLRHTGIRFEEGRLMEDLAFSCRVLYYAKRIVAVKDSVYFYSDVPNSILNLKDDKVNAKRKEDRRHAVELIKSFAKEKKITLPGVSFGIDQLHYIVRKYILSPINKKKNEQYLSSIKF